MMLSEEEQATFVAELKYQLSIVQDRIRTLETVVALSNPEQLQFNRGMAYALYAVLTHLGFEPSTPVQGKPQ